VVVFTDILLNFLYAEIHFLTISLIFLGLTELYLKGRGLILQQYVVLGGI
jgi:hypothetical protein